MGAIISDCKMYRYRLERDVLTKGKVGVFCWVNPSTADAETDDHSSRKGLGFAATLGWRRYILVNTFAYRAKYIRDLRIAHDPVGPDNDRHIEQAMRDADIHVVGWGSLSKLPESLRGRWKDIVRIADRVGCKLYCIGVCADGHPRHPLMTPYDIPMTEWQVPWFANRLSPHPSQMDKST
jgi:hypothetical protein